MIVYEKCCERRTYVRRVRTDSGMYAECPECGQRLRVKIVQQAKLTRTPSFEAFKSPVDGSIITSRRELAEHNRRNDVVNVHDGYDEAGVMGMINKDFQKPLDEERRKDLDKDIATGIQMLNEGYIPPTAPENEIIPE
ncbi:hypothetical protein [Stenotrophomonas phage BUCT555]|nr:hypothetical protein [Stenotrophomonas phage BUCT555]